MWVVVYEDLNLGYERASKVFDNKKDAWLHFYNLKNLTNSDNSIGLEEVGVYELSWCIN